MKAEKKCKGTGKALGHGCGELVPQVMYGKPNRQYGLGKSCGCFQEWVKETDEGKEYALQFATRHTNKKETERKKEERERLSEMKIESYGKEYRQKLDKACQKLARMIDNASGVTKCIDCGYPLSDTKQVDGGHFHSKGANSSLRWNLHNIHSQLSNCNQNGLGGGKQLGYYEGLIERYGKEYADRVRFDLVREHPTTKLTNKEVHEKLTFVNKLIRDFSTFDISNGARAREKFNKLIGIYK